MGAVGLFECLYQIHHRIGDVGIDEEGNAASVIHRVVFADGMHIAVLIVLGSLVTIDDVVGTLFYREASAQRRQHLSVFGVHVAEHVAIVMVDQVIARSFHEFTHAVGNKERDDAAVHELVYRKGKQESLIGVSEGVWKKISAVTAHMLPVINRDRMRCTGAL